MWYTATSASISNGSTIVQILAGDDIGIVQEDGGLIFESESPVQVKRGYTDGSGNNYIELQSPWPYLDKLEQPLVVYPTDASFAEATAELRRVIDTLEVASTTDMQVATNDVKISTPLKVKQAIDFHTGSAANRDVGESAGNVMEVGAFGLGKPSRRDNIDLNTLDVFYYSPILGTTGYANQGVPSGISFKNPAYPNLNSQLYSQQTTVGGGAYKGDLYYRNSNISDGSFFDWQKIYATGNILGTVSQSGGVPTGAIIESGSNVNGRYWKSAGGQLICDNNNNAITTNPATFVGSVTSIDGNKLRIGIWF